STGEKSAITATDDDDDTISVYPPLFTAPQENDVWRILVEVPQVTVTLPDVDGSGHVTVADGSITEPKIASNAFTAAKFASDVGTEIATSVWGFECEDQGDINTCKELVQLSAAMLFGECDFDNDDTLTCQDSGGNETRLVIVYGTHAGDRTSVTGTP